MTSCNMILIALLIVMGLLLFFSTVRNRARKEEIAWLLEYYPVLHLKHMTMIKLTHFNRLAEEYGDDSIKAYTRRELNRRLDNNLDNKVE